MITDEGVAELRRCCRDAMESFLRSADVTERAGSGQSARVLRAKAASWASMLEMLDEADEKTE